MTLQPDQPETDAILDRIDEVIMAGIHNGQSIEAIATYLDTEAALVRERYAALRADGRLYRYRLPCRRGPTPEAVP